MAALLLSAAPAHGEKVGAFLDAFNGSDPVAKAQYVYYFTGVQDALMYANDWMGPTGRRKPVCFPSRIPSREQLLKEFIEHAELATKKAGLQTVRFAEVDQLMLAGWIRKYPCPK